MQMKTMHRNAIGTLAIATLLGLGGCAGMSSQDKATAVGAVGGAVVGNVIGGGPLGTAAGAVVGGVVGHEVGKKK